MSQHLKNQGSPTSTQTINITDSSCCWFLFSEPGVLKVLAHLPEMKPRNNIVYYIQQLTKLFLLPSRQIFINLCSWKLGACQRTWMFLGFGPFPLIFCSTRNETQEQHSLLNTIFDYIVYFGPPGKYLYKNQENRLHVGRLRRPTCSKF